MARAGYAVVDVGATPVAIVDGQVSHLPYRLVDGRRRIASLDRVGQEVVYGGKTYRLVERNTADVPVGAKQRVVGETVEFTEGAVVVTPTVVNLPAREVGGLVNGERDRRIGLGVTVTTSEGQSIPVDTRGEADFRNISGLVQMAVLRQLASSVETVEFRGSDDNIYTLTPGEVIELGTQVAEFVNAHYVAAWALKDRAQGVPEDYAHGRYWPQ